MFCFYILLIGILLPTPKVINLLPINILIGYAMPSLCFFFQLTPIEKYALNYLEFFHASAEENESKENEVGSVYLLIYIYLHAICLYYF